MIPPPKIKRKNANSKATIFRYIPPFFEENAPIMIPTIASGITTQFPHPRKGIKHITAIISITMPHVSEIKLIMRFKF
jgi:hypothetical protein